METELDTKVRAALERRRGEWKAIAERAGISHSWISQFVRNKIRNPGYATLRDLSLQLQPLPAGESAAEGKEARDAA